MEIMLIGLDLAKNVFEVFGVDQKEQQVLRKTLKRSQVKVMSFFARTGPCTVAFESCGSALNRPAFLDGYGGYLQVDGYAAYDRLADVSLAGCWAHARRKFDEALKLLPKAKQRSGKGMIAINTVQKL